MNPLIFKLNQTFLSNTKVQDTSPEPANVASFKDILILDHDLNSNDGTASNNHHPHNGSNLNSAPFVIIQHTQVRTILLLWLKLWTPGN